MNAMHSTQFIHLVNYNDNQINKFFLRFYNFDIVVWN